MGREKLNVEERLQVLEILLEESIWGLHLERPEHRKAIASALYTRLEVANLHQAYSPGMTAALYEQADALSELDNTPDPLKPMLRPLVRYSGAAD
ncbi:hypothetical protein P245_06730 [Comamonas thiooxydans]|uniref:Uncharacterized protein n=1 Tax=Comamonas thiooxydans TaxID=363952 RepID=A0A0E3BKT1_9BURK|nr:hypothetical protein [Comamonas thiooxydans]KGG95542.1 hypothetical protein P245_06730 [Comamonas thiooxydans]